MAIAMVCMAYQLQAQNIEIGGRGDLGTFWLLNSATPISSGGSESKTLSLSYGGGLHLAYDFTDHAGIEANVLYGMLSQTYSGNYNNNGMLPDGTIYLNGESYTSKNSLTAIQFPLLLCLETDAGSFVEIGAEYQIIQNTMYTASYNSPSSSRSFNSTEYFAGSNIMGVLGFGGKYSIGNNFFLLTDFRIQYGFTDIKGLDGEGQAYASPYYSSYSATHALYGSVNLGLFYMIQITQTHKQGHQKCKSPPRVHS